MKNHPEYPDVCHDMDLPEDLIEQGFDGETLAWPERMSLCIDDLVLAINNSDTEILFGETVEITARWSTDPVDQMEIIKEALLFLYGSEGGE
jgi:hypothetical protein